jgi:hypothetical protein
MKCPRVDLKNVHAWTSKMSTRGGRQGPRKWTFQNAYTNVHYLRRPRVDIFEVHAWTSLSSRVALVSNNLKRFISFSEQHSVPDTSGHEGPTIVKNGIGGRLIDERHSRERRNWRLVD